MLNLEAAGTVKKIVVLNPKGGSGKTTLAFSLAGYLASTGRNVALLDMDKQGSSSRWLANRPADRPTIRAIKGPENPASAIRIPAEVDVVVVDAPAGLGGEDLIDFTCGAHAIFVPVLPSDIDIHAASRLVSDLLLKAQLSRRNGRLGIVANRVKERTVAYRQLMAFLDRLSINLIGVLRDSQNYTHAAAAGLCIHEMTSSRVSKDMAQWQAITEWLETRLATPLTARDRLRPASSQASAAPVRPRMWLPAAAAVGALAVALWFLAFQGGQGPEADVSPVPPAELLRAAPVHPIDPSPAPIRTDEAATASSEAPESLADRWRLTGVVQSRGQDILILADRTDGSTVRLDANAELDGWVVAESGRNFAVFRQDGDEVRLLLNEDTRL